MSTAVEGGLWRGRPAWRDARGRVCKHRERIWGSTMDPGGSESGVTNRKAGRGQVGKKNDPGRHRRERRRRPMETRQPGGRGGGGSSSEQLPGQRPHTVDTSVPLPLLTARAP